MKTYAPKSLRGYDLRRIMEEMAATPAQVAKFLEVTERSVWRWLAEDSAPRAVLCALWHETRTGREHSSNDVLFDLQLTRMGERIARESRDKQAAQLSRVLSICDTGAANDPLVAGPFAISRLAERTAESTSLFQLLPSPSTAKIAKASLLLAPGVTY